MGSLRAENKGEGKCETTDGKLVERLHRRPNKGLLQGSPHALDSIIATAVSRRGCAARCPHQSFPPRRTSVHNLELRCALQGRLGSAPVKALCCHGACFVLESRALPEQARAHAEQVRLNAAVHRHVVQAASRQPVLRAKWQCVSGSQQHSIEHICGNEPAVLPTNSSTTHRCRLQHSFFAQHSRQC